MRITVSLLAVMALSACNVAEMGGRTDPDSRVESGEDGAERSFALSGFDEVELEGPDDVRVTIGEEFSIRATGDEDELEDLDIRVSGDTLHVGRDSNSWLGSGASGRVTVYVTLPRLTGLAVAGSGNLYAERVETDDFEASVAGSGDLIIAELSVQDAEFNIAGSGSIEAAGTADELEIGIAGSGSVDASELEVARLEADIAGSGDVRGFVTEEAEASLLGSGDVELTGGARCSSNSLGSGELRCM